MNVPVPSIISETCEHVKRAGFKKAAILATEGTVSSRSYQNEFDSIGLNWAVTDADGQAILMDIIYGDVKRGVIPGREKLDAVIDPLKREGCDCAILACTELSLLTSRLEGDSFFVDSLEVLAECAVRMFDKEYIP